MSMETELSLSHGAVRYETTLFRVTVICIYMYHTPWWRGRHLIGCKKEKHRSEPAMTNRWNSQGLPVPKIHLLDTAGEKMWTQIKTAHHCMHDYITALHTETKKTHKKIMTWNIRCRRHGGKSSVMKHAEITETNQVNWIMRIEIRMIKISTQMKHGFKKEWQSIRFTLTPQTQELTSMKHYSYRKEEMGRGTGQDKRATPMRRSERGWL